MTYKRCSRLIWFRHMNATLPLLEIWTSDNTEKSQDGGICSDRAGLFMSRSMTFVSSSH